jgi:translation initiation factor IF-3
MRTYEALKLAQQKELDLVVVAAKTNPPVAKILDFNKFLYEERKKKSSAKTKSKISEVKEFRFGPAIGDADLQKRIERAADFVQRGDKVKITLQMRGRSITHPEIGMEKIERFVKGLAEIAKVESEPKLVRNIISVTFVKK